MNEIKISKENRERIVQKVKKYFADELDQDIGGFDAEFSIDFFAKEIGSHCYNQGLFDAHSLFTEKSEEIGYLVQELEKPIN
ncbi:MAG: DUF2164 domain-containing protein [Agarilytica sp.]